MICISRQRGRQWGREKEAERPNSEEGEREGLPPPYPESPLVYGSGSQAGVRVPPWGTCAKGGFKKHILKNSSNNSTSGSNVFVFFTID